MHHMAKRKSSDTRQQAGEGLLLHEQPVKSQQASLSKHQEELQQFLNSRLDNASVSDTGSRRRLATLARAETLEDYEGSSDERPPNESGSKTQTQQTNTCCPCNILRCLRKKRIFIPLIILACIAAIYCIPYIEIEPKVPRLLPHIPFNFRDGPLSASSASQFKVVHLFRDQISGPESVAIDSLGNMYMAIEGGFILYAYLNRTNNLLARSMSLDWASNGEQLAGREENPDLVKIAELNAIKQLPYDHRRRRAEGSNGGASWRRECQLDEKVYGQNLFSTHAKRQTNALGGNEIDTSPIQPKKFVSHVLMSRCSKPLGLRLSPDESYLYVIDTLSGLYRVALKVFEKPYSSQRQVTKLIDFRTNASQLLPILQLDAPATGKPPRLASQAATPAGQQNADQSESQDRQEVAYMNVTLRAADDLAIDYGVGTNKGDIIYISLASQSWRAVSFLYDLLEVRPTGALLRYDTGSNQLSVLNPSQVAHVRLAGQRLTGDLSYEATPDTANVTGGRSPGMPYYGIGAPHLDENDVFDDRPLHFPNGLQLTDDRQAILVADTVNKRIIKHWIRGPRKGTSDLWAWTPNFPDNIRRGFDKDRETYWVVGCGQDTTNKIDMLVWLNGWPRLRKYLLKNIYLFGWTVEMLGAHLVRSTSVRDFGYGIRMGHTLCENACMGMMILQYNSYGDIIRSIYSKEFPNDLLYYSQANEVIDANKQEHVLYLSSPGYRYVTKLILPTESFDLPPPPPI